MNSIESALTDANPDDRTPLWIAIPTGYFSLPLDGITDKLQNAQSVLTETAGQQQSARIDMVTSAMDAFLADLATTGALYCGIGRHTSASDETVVTSTLVVSYQEYEGTRNPRLLLKDILRAKADANEAGDADIIDVGERPILFFERTRDLPTPQLPGTPEVPDDATSSVYQLEALVPSDEGDKLATVQLSTPFASHGPEFRTMVVQLAASASFKPPESTSESSSRIQQLLG